MCVHMCVRRVCVSCVCVCVCMCVCVCACTCICIHVYIHLRLTVTELMLAIMLSQLWTTARTRRHKGQQRKFVHNKPIVPDSRYYFE